MVYVIGSLIVLSVPTLLFVFSFNMAVIIVASIIAFSLLMVIDIKTVKLYEVRKRDGAWGSLLGDKFVK